MSSDSTIKIAGAAGQGMQTIGFILGKVLTRSGLHVFAMQDNESRIRGGHNFFQLRISGNRILSMTERVDILVALNQNGVDLLPITLKQHLLRLGQCDGLPAGGDSWLIA